MAANKNKLCDFCNRICPICNNDLPIEQFYKGKEKSSGSRRICKKCNYIKVKDWHINYNNINKDHRNEWKRNYHKTENGQKVYKKIYEKRKENPHKDKIRDILNKFLKRKNKKKLEKTHEILGYSYLDFKKKFPIIEQGYQIDHIVPISWFVNDVPANIANSLNNLQLLLGSINMSKQDRYCDIIEESFYNQMIIWIKEEYKNKVLYARSK
jgi:hypothetical protein